MGWVLRDVKYAVRLLVKQPRFTAVAVLAIALGTGANTAIFSVVDAVLLRPLPFRNSSQLVDIFFRNRRFPDRGMSVTRENLTEIRLQARQIFSWLGRYELNPLGWTSNGRTTVIVCGAVSHGFFEALGITPALGRFFLSGEFQRGRGDVAVLSHRLWISAYDANPKVLGRTITLNGTPRVIVGVAPPGLHFLGGRFEGYIGAWVPSGAPGTRAEYGMLARLRSNVSLAEARAGLETIAGRLALQDPAKYKGWSFTATPIHEMLTGDVRPGLLLLLGATLLVLLIAVVNVANLLLARGWQRAKEVAVQNALGASRRRVIFQWAVESCLLGLLGGLAGLALALCGLRLLRDFASPNLLRMPAAQLNWEMTAFCMGVAAAAGILIGVVPAIQISHLDPNAVLHSGDASGRTGGSRELRKAMSGLMVAEIALAFSVTAGSILLIRSYASLMHVHTGMRVHHALTLRVFVPPETYPKYSKPEQWKPFVENLLARVRSLPGVESVSATDLPLLMGFPPLNIAVRADGIAVTPTDDRTVTPGYFRTLGIPVLAGRTFSGDSQANEVVINEAFAHRAWGNVNPIGTRISLGHGERASFLGQTWPSTSAEVVGVVENTHNEALNTPIAPAIYGPLYQYPFDGLAFVVHTALPPSSLVAAVERRIWSGGPDLAITHVRTMTQLIADNEVGSRSRTCLLGIFASLGLVLAVLGVYGVFSYAVTRRTHEFGIRMALGAQRGDVLRLVVSEGARLAAVGIAIGLVAMFILARLMRSLLFGVTATDPATLVATAILITAVSLLACYLPARRAAQTDPATALRYE
jgi:putative ABC transport system permease protein